MAGPEFLNNLSENVRSAIRTGNQAKVDTDQQVAIDYLTKHVRVLWNHVERLEKMLSVGNARGAVTAPVEAPVVINTARDGTLKANGVVIHAAQNLQAQAGRNIDMRAANRMELSASKITIKTGDGAITMGSGGIEMTTGAATVSLKKDGSITLKGKDVTIDASGRINVKASADITMKGSKINQN